MVDETTSRRWLPTSRSLSPRERQTLTLLLDGQAEKQIARVLQISKATVHVYVKGVYRSYGVSGRAELFAMFLKHTLNCLDALASGENLTNPLSSQYLRANAAQSILPPN
jgi:DNA-binding CsgD family transcriptional regulator